MSATLHGPSPPAAEPETVMPPADLAVQILARVPLPVWVLDVDGVVAFANDAAASALGYRDPGVLRGLQGHETVHHHRPDGSEYPVGQCPLLRPASTGETAAADDEWFIRRDGSLLPITWSAAPIELPNGRGTVLSFQDRTARLPRPVGGAGRDGLLAAATDHIARHAADPALTPQRLAREHHVSLRLLQSVFAASGTSPARCIREQRLRLARRLLLEGAPVGVAATRSGFTDVGTFTRAFRRWSGSTPSALAGRAAGIPPAVDRP